MQLQLNKLKVNQLQKLKTKKSWLQNEWYILKYNWIGERSFHKT